MRSNANCLGDSVEIAYINWKKYDFEYLRFSFDRNPGKMKNPG